ncbi:hypothetical protein M0R45_005000 [Rubus argutus]|uniref:Uncharacterized protein n=1 Tax=Rubus argutus TaxID=59490 RepID=A0AAW1YLD5_RUBAR
MSFEADFGTWGALLAASSVHSNVEIGELAAKNMLDLDPQSFWALCHIVQYKINLHMAADDFADINVSWSCSC